MELKKRITEILRQLNVSPANKGYGYLRDAIEKCVNDKEFYLTFQRNCIRLLQQKMTIPHQMLKEQ